MVEFPFIISKNLTPYNIVIGSSLQLIHIKFGDNDANRFITVNADNQSYEVDMFGDIIVEGKVITVMAKTLPNDTTWQFSWEPLQEVQNSSFEWGVQAGKEQKIYEGKTERRFAIQGPQAPQNQDSKPVKGEEPKSLLVYTDGIKSGVVVQGSSIFATGANIIIIANEPGDDLSLSGQYNLLDQ